ncbi:hypothetical protein NQ315_007962 [Exocentrus adspersus]|uniref:KilA-N DNA-binding domain-containing protein n=1 Tax=Exocentrus adspersus TaxID=1586481 RepID=A0AAV8V6F1_9CUCU|nr:hypothetical protein NQ315_007962 [Exocentrus adspersus]
MTQVRLLEKTELCLSRPGKAFIPKHHCTSGILCNTTKNYPEQEIRKIVERNRKKFAPLPGSVIEPAENHLFAIN